MDTVPQNGTVCMRGKHEMSPRSSKSDNRDPKFILLIMFSKSLSLLYTFNLQFCQVLELIPVLLLFYICSFPNSNSLMKS